MAQQKSPELPPVFITLDDLNRSQTEVVLNGPWKKKDTIEFFHNEFVDNRLGVSAAPFGPDIDVQTELALRSSPGNVEVGVLHKTNPKEGSGWEETSFTNFANSASLFIDSPNTNPTVHAPVDINWMGITQEEKTLKLSDEVREKEINWLKKEIPNKVRPFLNVIALKKAEGYLDEKFKMPIVFHSTPAHGLYNILLMDKQGNVKPNDILRTSGDFFVDEKTGEVIVQGDIEKLAELKGKKIEPLKESYVPLHPEGKNIEDHYNFHKELVNYAKEKSLVNSGIVKFNENIFTKEDIDLYLKREEIKKSLLREFNEELNNSLAKGISDLELLIKKHESKKNLIEDLYKSLEEIKRENFEIVDDRFRIKDNVSNLEEKIREITGSSIRLSKLEESGITTEEIEDILKSYAELDHALKFGTREEFEKQKEEFSNKLKKLYSDLEKSKEFILPQERQQIVSSLATEIRRFYKRLGEEDKVEKIENELKSLDTDKAYNSLKNELNNLVEKVKDNKDKLANLKPLENVALEKASDTIAEFAKELIKKDPAFKEHAFLAIENFFPEDMFGGKVEVNGKKEWAMKVLLEKSREKLAEKLAKEQNLNEEEAKQVANEFIGMTLDMGHFNLWRSRGKFENDEQFEEMATDFVKSVSPFVRHVHLTDNPGTEDTHQEIGTGNVPNELAIQILKEHWEKEGIEPTITIEWGGDTGLRGKQPSNYENWRRATVPYYGSQSVRAYSTLYQSFEYQLPSGFYYKDEPYATSWLM
ncbi:MAG: hypothetical protein ABGW69_01310 [Nanoarchaeota archaeon]